MSYPARAEGLVNMGRRESHLNKCISSWSCRAASTDIPDPLSPHLPIIHRLWQVFRVTSHIITYMLHVCSSWPFCFWLAICGGSQEYITYELVLARDGYIYSQAARPVVWGGKYLFPLWILLPKDLKPTQVP